MSQTISTIHVPPEGNPNSKLWLVGESPGAEEEKELKPFVGPSGLKLMQALSTCGVAREDVYLCNLSNYRPNGNKFEFLRDTQLLKDSVDNLQARINKYRPNCIGLLGANPLKYIAGKTNISSYRGSILSIPSDNEQCIKVIPTYHPSYVLRSPEYYPIFLQDIKRITYDSTFPQLSYTPRNYVLDPDVTQISNLVTEIFYRKRVTCDIETYRGGDILCVGFGLSSTYGVCLSWTPFNKFHIKNILESPEVEKIFHFGAFDCERLFLSGIHVRNVVHDTIVGQHILEPELPRSLAFLTSIYTREPYYKKEGRGEIPGDVKVWSAREEKKDLYIYNCKDVCTTYEVYEHQVQEIKNRQLDSLFSYEMSLLPIAQSIGRTGMLIDTGTQEVFREALTKKIDTYQFCLDALCGQPLNVNSSKQVCDMLYSTKGLPLHTHDHNRTADEDALIDLIGHCTTRLSMLKTKDARDKWTSNLEIVKCILTIRQLRKKVSSYVNITISDDKRVRSTYDVTGTLTGRWSCSKYVDDSGLNAQTLPRDEIIV